MWTVALTLASLGHVVVDGRYYAPAVPRVPLCSARPSSRLRGGASGVTALADYSGAAKALFENVRVPASIIGGSIVPLGLAMNVDGIKSPRLKAFFERAYTLLAVASLSNELVAVVISSVSVNKLSEVATAPAASVHALIHRDYEMQWLGVNFHFLAGLFGLAGMVGIKAFTHFGLKWGVIPLCVTGSSLALMVSIVNDGCVGSPARASPVCMRCAHALCVWRFPCPAHVLARVVQGDGQGGRFARSIVSLSARYGSLLVSRAFGSPSPLKLVSLLLAMVAAARCVHLSCKALSNSP